MRLARAAGALLGAAAAVALCLAVFDVAAARATLAATALLSAAALAGGFARPETATLALVALAPALPALPRYFGDAKGGPAMLAIACAGFGAALARRLRDGEPSPLSGSFRRWASAFLAVAGVSAVSSMLRGETLYLLRWGGADPLFVNGLWMSAGERNRAAVAAFLASLLLLVAFDALARVRREALTKALLCAGVLGAVIACAEPLLPLSLTGPPWIYIHRRSGSFSDPNALGVGLALLMPLMAGSCLPALARAGGDRLRQVSGDQLAGLAGLALGGFALNASGSRSGLLLLLAAAGAAGLGLFRGRPRLRPALVGCLIAAVTLAAAAWRYGPRGHSTSSGRLLERIGSAFSAEGVEDLATHRPLFWGTAFQVIKEEPLSGCGLGAFPFEFPLRYQKTGPPITVTDNATNALLDLAAEAGLPALLLALAAAIPLLVRALDAALGKGSDPGGRAAGAAFVGLAVASLTGSHLRFPEIALLAAGVAALLPGDREAAEEEASAPRRAAPVLALSGIVASILVVLPTRKAETAFRAGHWVGVYGWELHEDGTNQRWMGPRAFRSLRPKERTKEEKISLVMVNVRPDSRPVLVTVDAEGRRLLSKTIAVGTPTALTLEPPADAEALRFRFEPTFVPRRRTGQPDFRELSVLLAWDSGDPR